MIQNINNVFFDTTNRSRSTVAAILEKIQKFFFCIFLHFKHFQAYLEHFWCFKMADTLAAILDWRPSWKKSKKIFLHFLHIWPYRASLRHILTILEIQNGRPQHGGPPGGTILIRFLVLCLFMKHRVLVFFRKKKKKTYRYHTAWNAVLVYHGSYCEPYWYTMWAIVSYIEVFSLISPLLHCCMV